MKEFMPNDSVYQECHINIPVLPFLRKHLSYSARLYDEDISIYENVLREAAKRGGEQAFFWIGRNSGAYCASERVVFIPDSTANQECQYDIPSPFETVNAFIVEVTDMIGCEVIGNVFKLNREAYAKEVNRFTRPTLRAHNMPPETNSVTTHVFSIDSAWLDTVLYYHKQCRRSMAKAG